MSTSFWHPTTPKPADKAMDDKLVAIGLKSGTRIGNGWRMFETAETISARASATSTTR
jgi:hypothetical protein